MDSQPRKPARRKGRKRRSGGRFFVHRDGSRNVPSRGRMSHQYLCKAIHLSYFQRCVFPTEHGPCHPTLRQSLLGASTSVWQADKRRVTGLCRHHQRGQIDGSANFTWNCSPGVAKTYNILIQLDATGKFRVQLAPCCFEAKPCCERCRRGLREVSVGSTLNSRHTESYMT